MYNTYLLTSTFLCAAVIAAWKQCADHIDVFTWNCWCTHRGRDVMTMVWALGLYCHILNRALEAILIIAATTSVAYFCSMFMGTCVPRVLESGPNLVRRPSCAAGIII